MLWVKSNKGDIIWTVEAKLFLIRQIRNNMIVLNNAYTNEISEQKDKAWHTIYKNCVRNGMPDCLMENFRKKWSRFKCASRIRIAEYKRSKLGKTFQNDLLNVVDRAIGDLMEHYYRSRNMKNEFLAGTFKNTGETKTTTAPVRAPETKSQQSVFKKPLFRVSPRKRSPSPSKQPQRVLRKTRAYSVKPPSPDTRRPTLRNRALSVHQDESQRKQDYQLNEAKPIVVLNNIAKDLLKTQAQTECPDAIPSTSNATPTTLVSPQQNVISNNLIKIQEQIAMNELKYKQALRENEEERMEFEREIFRKQITLLDLKIKKNNLQIDYYVKGGGN